MLIGDQNWMLGGNFATDPTKTSAEMYPWFYASEGTFKVFKNVKSTQLNNARDVIVYLPPSYNENTLKIHQNVLLMHDGNNLFDP